jgi:hypothetical protein
MQTFIVLYLRKRDITITLVELLKDRIVGLFVRIQYKQW